MPKINRLTLFKIPESSDIQEAIKKYSTLTQDAKKNDTTYILAANAIPNYSDPRNQGFTLTARTVFASKEDMDFYDNECKAHGEIKALLKSKVAGPPLMVYMDIEE